MAERSTATSNRSLVVTVALAAQIAGFLLLRGAPVAQAGDVSPPESAWRDRVHGACRVSTHAAFGTLAELDSLGEECGNLRFLRCRLAVSKLFRGDADSSRPFTFWVREEAHQRFTVGEKWVIFATRGVEPSLAPKGEAQSLAQFRLVGDSVKAWPLPTRSTEAFFNLLATELAQTPVDSLLFGIR